ncbi:hypothetical protein Dimus_020051 [Dionaea muscipula]
MAKKATSSAEINNEATTRRMKNPIHAAALITCSPSTIGVAASSAISMSPTSSANIQPMKCSSARRVIATSSDERRELVEAIEADCSVECSSRSVHLQQLLAAHVVAH